MNQNPTSSAPGLLRSVDDLRGPAGRIEALLNMGRAEAAYAALVCHPHPLFGGTMHNKVVYHAMKAFQAYGLPVLRFNFRGAGLSEGAHDHGRGEVSDVRAALDWLQREYQVPLLFAGFSFGSSDAKGIIAAQVAAAERLREAGVSAALLFVVGVERESAGAREANLHPRGSRFLINGEPTDNRLALASKGVLRVQVSARGTMAHSAYPELGDSAVHKLVQVLERLRTLPLPSVEGVGPSTLNIGVIEGGHAPNVIADAATAQVLIRLVGPSDETRKAVEQAAAGLAEVEFTLEIPFIRMRQVEGLDTMVAAFTTDIPALSQWGEPLLLGPGSIHVAHTPFEKIAKRELLEAVDLYFEVAQRLALSL